MNISKCLKILRDVKSVAFATVGKDNLPKIRIIDIMIAENEKIYFLTARGKAFYNELMISKSIALTCLTHDWKSIRLNGKAEKLADNNYWINRMFEENTSMNDVYPNESRSILEPFVIENFEVEYFDLSQSPIFREYFQTDKFIGNDKGYKITNACIKCGVCQKICPQQCIEFKTQYYINQNNCLHCGLCKERCPINAIISDNIDRNGDE